MKLCIIDHKVRIHRTLLTLCENLKSKENNNKCKYSDIEINIKIKQAQLRAAAGRSRHKSTRAVFSNTMPELDSYYSNRFS